MFMSGWRAPLPRRCAHDGREVSALEAGAADDRDQPAGDSRLRLQVYRPVAFAEVSEDLLREPLLWHAEAAPGLRVPDDYVGTAGVLQHGHGDLPGVGAARPPEDILRPKP